MPLFDRFTIKKIIQNLKEISEKTNVKWFKFEERWYLHALDFKKHQNLNKDRIGEDKLPSYNQSKSGVSQELVGIKSGVSPPEVEVEVKDKDKVEVEGIAGGETSSHFSNPKKFQKPNETEVKAYAKSIDFELDGSAFCDFYESKGWMIGKTPMNDWKAAVRTWKRSRTSEFNKPKEKKYEERWAPKGTSEIQGSTSGF